MRVLYVARLRPRNHHHVGTYPGTCLPDRPPRGRFFIFRTYPQAQKYETDETEETNVSPRERKCGVARALVVTVRRRP